MKTKVLLTLFVALTLLILAGFNRGEATSTLPGPNSASPAAVNVVELTASHLAFEGPDESPSGWTTIRLQNASHHTHFAILNKMPADKGIEDHQAEVAPVFQEGAELLWAGDIPAALAKFGELPSWYAEVAFVGGPGLIAPGRTAQATMHLEPGTYVIECYVVTDGVFHSYNPNPSEFGMVHELTVTDDPSGATEPRATLEMILSSSRGIEVAGTVRPGLHTVKVSFADQTMYDNFVGHDVHLARLQGDTDLAALEAWMNWTLPGGLETPAPATFLGGINDLPAGSTGYFTVLLEPGNYAWIAEVPDASAKGMLQAFTVPAD